MVQAKLEPTKLTSQLRCKINNVVIHNIKIFDVYLMRM